MEYEMVRQHGGHSAGRAHRRECFLGKMITKETKWSIKITAVATVQLHYTSYFLPVNTFCRGCQIGIESSAPAEGALLF
jgi:hypothetical protein